MGIKPEGSTPVIIPPDNVQTRWGEWEADLDANGAVAGEVLLETWALADSANSQVALIPKGYCAAYMDRNVNLEWSGNTRRLPFRAQLGPAQGAHLEPSQERIVFDITGTWTVHVLASFNGSSWGGDNGVHIDIFVRNPDGSLYSEWRVRGAPGGEEGTLGCSKPVVIDRPGMWVDVVCRSGKWRWWPGGTRFSSLAVIRSALGTDHAGDPEVPDENDPNPDPPVAPDPEP